MLNCCAWKCLTRFLRKLCVRMIIWYNQQLTTSCAFPVPLYRYQLYVDNLPPNTTDMDLLKMFSPFGAIRPGGTKAMLASDGTCTGIGYVNFNSQREALAAASALNQVILPVGQALIVKAASKKVVDSSAWDFIEEAADKKT